MMKKMSKKIGIVSQVNVSHLANIIKSHRHNHSRSNVSAFVFFIPLLTSILFCTVSGDQRFALEPQDRTAIVGETIIMACRVVNKKGNLQWSRDGFGLGTDRELKGYPRYTMTGNDDEGDYSLQIRNVNLEDDAPFQCQVGASEGFRAIMSRSAQLTVFVPPEPPKIVNGDFVSTVLGNEVELTCESDGGKPAAELTWLDGDGNPASVGKLVPTRKTLSDQKRENSALKWTFHPTKEDDGKTFTCRSENQALKQPHKAFVRLEVKFAPDVTLITDKEQVTEGDEITFGCSAVGNPAENLVYKWYKNNEIIPGDHSSKFTIRKVTSEWDDTEISCEVSNIIGSGKATHHFKINFGPFFRRPLRDSYGAKIGEEVKLVCDIAGSPTPEIIWLFEREAKVLGTKSELLIPSMNYESAGRYTCRASVPGFPELTATTQVFIKGPPSLAKTAQSQIGSEGETMTVECLIQSVSPLSKVSWTRNSQPIEVDNNFGYQLVEERSRESESIIKNLLVIPRAKKEDFTSYNCTAENEFGSHFMTITLKEQKHFPSLTIIAAIIGGVVFVVTVTITVILCMKRATGLDGSDQGLHDKKQNCSASVLDSSSEGGQGSGHSNGGHTHHGIHHEWKPGASTSSEHSSGTDSKSIPPTIPFHPFPSVTENYHKGNHDVDMNASLGYSLYDSMNHYNVVSTSGTLHPMNDHLVSSYYSNTLTNKDMVDMNNVTHTNLYDTRYNMVCDLNGSSTITGINHILTGVNPVTHHNIPIDPQFVQAANNWKPYNGTSTLV